MKKLITTASVAVTTSMLVFAAPSHAAEEPCVSGQEVRAQVQELVAGLRDDVKSPKARSAVALALVETMETSRGETAETPRERAALGRQISALAKQQADSENRVEGRALALAIVALTEQRRGGGLTEEERAGLTKGQAKLRKAVVKRTSNKQERREVAADFKALKSQFTCTPS